MDIHNPASMSNVDRRLELLDAEIAILGDALVVYALKESAYAAIWDAYTKRHDEYMKLFQYKMNFPD